MSWSRTRAALRPARTAAVAVAAVLVATTLAACGSDADEQAAPAGDASAGFPVTLKNTFGETTIEKKPERIVTLGWNAQDVVYALDETPVGMPKITYGPTPAGVTAWDTEHFDAAKTTLLDTTDSIPFEKVAALRPDVILAPYEGFDKATYTKLSEIAPTVAYPGAPWQTTWQDQTTIIGKALGKSAEADKLVAGIKELTTKAAADHPEFKGKTLSILSYGAENYAYMPGDPRVQILNEMGFVNAPGIESLEQTNSKKEFALTVSKERLNDLDADVVVGYIDGMTPEKFAADPVYASLPAFKKGSTYLMTDQQLISGMSAVSVLSVPWVLDKILPGLSKAAEAAS
ncbi:iron-siderophore ABC transporter substrate-binding protein [Kribbella sp. VKM Ac-2568]|uniref:iron-siderophore ABC transporter substrate-binding protein n=1 Tax=Kribbella sp. VKM Ac-2568 TaxID=2512219 RepID=UPI001044D17F|nr:iron-siderophore ABC transporter substrate-binding protein [Kribbella sp. VKM Ac-2568]TCM47028.1 iron complex transport system substrate-binding protein [Kribbella sp. VKM Ac-2568]